MNKVIKGVSLFSNVGIDECYFLKNGIKIVGSNEIDKKRCDFYSHLYPEVQMICGDIRDQNVYNKMVEIYKKNNCEFLIATPPCQGMSQAGKMEESDIRNRLIIDTVEFIKETEPLNIIIENVPNILKFSVMIGEKKVKITDYIERELKPLGYFLNYSVLDAVNYKTPQYRKRAIFLISKIEKWDFPEINKRVTVRDAIEDLPSLESGESSFLPYHFSKTHNENHVLWMSHTPTGKTAFDNKDYFPQKDGRRIKGFRTTYKRIDWDRPAPAITMCNGAVSSQNNVHPGKKLKSGLYSDARVLTVLELLRLTGLPDDWNIPPWATDSLIRKVIGEAFPPKFAESLIQTMPNMKEGKNGRESILASSRECTAV